MSGQVKCCISPLGPIWMCMNRHLLLGGKIVLTRWVSLAGCGCAGTFAKCYRVPATWMLSVGHHKSDILKKELCCDQQQNLSTQVQLYPQDLASEAHTTHPSPRNISPRDPTRPLSTEEQKNCSDLLLLDIVVLRDASTHPWLLGSTGAFSVYRKRLCVSLCVCGGVCVFQLWCKVTEQGAGNQCQWSTSKPKFNPQLRVFAL